jgi:hypothetical protein
VPSSQIGLLPKDNIEQVPFAYKIFKKNNEEVAKGFKAAFCRTVTVDFLGVWWVSWQFPFLAKLSAKCS